MNGEQTNSFDTLDSGAVYVFTRSSTGTWSQQAYIKASNTGGGDRDNFGYAVSLSGDGNSLAVGSNGEDSNATGVGGSQGDVNGNFNAGAVYVFTRSSTGTLSQQAYVKASNTGKSDLFGSAVNLSDDGNTLAVGTFQEDSDSTGTSGAQDNDNATDSGAVYLY